MDNLTHSLVGWALGQTGLKRQSRKGLAALILGANMPDIDVFFGWAGWEPLAMHRGVTHSLVAGLVVMPPLLAGLLWLLDRWQVSRGAQFKSGLEMRFGRLLALAYLATATHPSMDLLTTYSVQLLSPFSGAWFHADALFIIDIWVWLLLAAAIAWSKRREKRGGDWTHPPRVAFAIMLAYISLNLAISDRAVAAVRRLSPGVQRIFASPPPIWSWRRGLVWLEGGCYRRAAYDPLGAGFEPRPGCARPGLDQPLVREAMRQEPTLQKFLRWSVMPEAHVELGRCAARVWIGDARYGAGRRSRLAREVTIPLRAPGC